MRKSREVTTDGFYDRLHAKLEDYRISVLIKGESQASLFLMHLVRFKDVDFNDKRLSKMYVQVGDIRLETELAEGVKSFPCLEALVKWVDED